MCLAQGPQRSDVGVGKMLFIIIIYLYLKRTAHLAINASLPCVPLKHIYIYTQVKHMIKHRICQV